MLQVGGGADFQQEAIGGQLRAYLRLEHLDRHLAVMLEVLGEVDRGHAAGAELPLDGVAVGEEGLEAFDGHRPASEPRDADGAPARRATVSVIALL